MSRLIILSSLCFGSVIGLPWSDVRPRALPSGWSYKGCYVDNPNGRVMNVEQPDNSSLTIESCITTCSQLGYKVAGMEYSVQCFCDNYLRNAAPLATTDSECNMACRGNAAEKCGGSNRVSVYSNATLTILPVPVPRKTGLPGSWKYRGCLRYVYLTSTPEVEYARRYSPETLGTTTMGRGLSRTGS
jgi:hypothetical protein